MSALNKTQIPVEEIGQHYDRISTWYRVLCGDHIHHGYWDRANSIASAQQRLVEHLASCAQIKPNSVVLDVGCGLGGSAFWLAENLGCSVLGITNSPVQAKLATKRSRARRLQSAVQFQVMDADRLRLAPESFDAVWIIECTEHLFDRPHFIANCARVLKRGGSLALTSWLIPDRPLSGEDQHLIECICEGMRCPSLATFIDVMQWLYASGFDEIYTEDLTKRVEETWVRWSTMSNRRLIKALLLLSPGTRSFLETCESTQSDMAYSRPVSYDPPQLEPVPHLGPVPINWYGITFVLGFLVGGWLTLRWAQYYTIRRETVEGLLLWVMIGTIVGARIYFVLQNELLDYLRHPWNVLAIWEGGLAYFGGLLAQCWQHSCISGGKASTFRGSRIWFAPAIPVGSAIGPDQLRAGRDGLRHPNHAAMGHRLHKHE